MMTTEHVLFANAVNQLCPLAQSAYAADSPAERARAIARLEAVAQTARLYQQHVQAYWRESEEQAPSGLLPLLHREERE